VTGLGLFRKASKVKASKNVIRQFSNNRNHLRIRHMRAVAEAQFMFGSD
jgi:hypothetical protein